MLRLLKLKPFRKLKVVQRLLERRQARKLRNESAADFAVVEDDRQVAEQRRTGSSQPPAPHKVSGDNDDADASRPDAPSRQRDRASNDLRANCGLHAASDAPVDASESVEAAAAGAAADPSTCSKRPYHVQAQASSSGSSAQRSLPPPNPYESVSGEGTSPPVSRLRRDSGSTPAAEGPVPSLPHASSHRSERRDSAAGTGDGSNASNGQAFAGPQAAVIRGDREGEIARRRRSSNRMQSGSDSRRHRSKALDEQSAASADCDRTDGSHRCPTATAIAAAPAVKDLSSTGVTATEADSAAPTLSPPPRSRLRRRHSMPARDRAPGGGGDSAMQRRLHRLRRSFTGGLRASRYTELTGGDSQSVLGPEMSVDERREPFSKTLRRSFRESFRYGLQSLSAAGIGSGIGMAMAPSFAMSMPFGGVMTTV